MNSPGTSLTAPKEALREELRRRLRGLTTESRAESSIGIQKRCIALPEWSRSQCVALYHPRPDEPDLWPLVEWSWAEAKMVVLPAYDASRAAYRWCRVTGSQDLVSGRFGILEPREDCERVDAVLLDLAFVPGLGFSPDGGRLGRGRGFYDRLLESVSGKCFGVAFEFQILPQIPREDHDIVLDGVITPSGCRYAPSGAPNETWPMNPGF